MTPPVFFLWDSFMPRGLTEEERESLKRLVAWVSDRMRRSDWFKENQEGKGLEVDLVRLIMYLTDTEHLPS